MSLEVQRCLINKFSYFKNKLLKFIYKSYIQDKNRKLYII